MATDSLPAIDSAGEEMYRWVREILDELGWGDRHDALHALRAVLHALRDRLLTDQMANLSAQLPLLIRGLFFENWDPSRTPVIERKVEGFVDHVLVNVETARGVGYADELDGAEIVRAVLTVLTRHVSPGEAQKIKQSFPKEFSALFESPSNYGTLR